MTEEPWRPRSMFNELKIKPAEGQEEIYMCTIYQTLDAAICPAVDRESHRGQSDQKKKKMLFRLLAMRAETHPTAHINKTKSSAASNLFHSFIKSAATPRA